MELRFKLKRSFHVQFSAWALIVIKLHIFAYNMFRITWNIITVMIYFIFKTLKINVFLHNDFLLSEIL